MLGVLQHCRKCALRFMVVAIPSVKIAFLGLQWAVVKFPHFTNSSFLFLSHAHGAYLFVLPAGLQGKSQIPSQELYFLLWMVESMNGDRVKSHSTFSGDNHPVWPANGNASVGSQVSTLTPPEVHHIRHIEPSGQNHALVNNYLSVERLHSSLRKVAVFLRSFDSKVSTGCDISSDHLVCNTCLCSYIGFVHTYHGCVCSPIVSSSVLRISKFGLACQGNHHLRCYWLALFTSTVNISLLLHDGASNPYF
ncbi:hypothetical protein GBA52_029082 [Prunus armeniaca]|nr:hypothetical protein GBA52_029082 [Prunus armeniaca]